MKWSPSTGTRGRTDDDTLPRPHQRGWAGRSVPIDRRGVVLDGAGPEPDVPSDAADFVFPNRLHPIELEDVEARLERCQVSGYEAAMLTAGLAPG